ncbi:hypothetical protein ES708_35253 [subsurface metagenome]|jgi:hypothetical protein
MPKLSKARTLVGRGAVNAYRTAHTALHKMAIELYRL